MDFRFSEEAEKFRSEVQGFIKEELPSDWIGMGSTGGLEAETDEEWEFCSSMKRKLGAMGWLSLAWPEEYGGQGDLIKQFILNEEMFYNEAPGVDFPGACMLAPVLMRHGTDDQKKAFLPSIARGEATWCQGFSEPGAGSDLAALSTRAKEEEDCFVIEGQKVWTSNAHRADRCFFIARTDPTVPKHKGISFFLLDMKTPNITIRPLQDIVGGRFFNEVFFDNVRVPKENLVGQRNQGWEVTMSTLGFERSGVHRLSSARRSVAHLVEYMMETKGEGLTSAQIVMFRQKLAELYLEGELGRLLAMRVAWVQSQGKVVEHEASMSRVFGCELLQRVSNTGMQLLGLYGQLKEGSKWARLRGRLASDYLGNVAATVGAGTSEIQRNVIALRGLGLPRG